MISPNLQSWHAALQPGRHTSACEAGQDSETRETLQTSVTTRRLWRTSCGWRGGRRCCATPPRGGPAPCRNPPARLTAASPPAPAARARQAAAARGGRRCRMRRPARFPPRRPGRRGPMQTGSSSSPSAWRWFVCNFREDSHTKLERLWLESLCCPHQALRGGVPCNAHV